MYVVNAVLLREKLDGGDGAAQACAPVGGCLGWLHLSIPL
jgi:hypothetical protein